MSTSVPNPISYMSANLVAEPVGFRMTKGWMQGDYATNDLFRSTEHFADRFERMVTDVKALGFDVIDIWCAHLNPTWATARQLESARTILARHEMKVGAYLWYGGSTTEDIRVVARVLEALGTDLISGMHGLLGTDRAAFVAALRALNLRFAYENHPETSAAQVLEKIGPGDEDVLGVAFDTGWAATKGFDALEALDGLLPRLFYLHAKDVKAPRAEKTGFDLIDSGHETCALGDGIIPIEAVVRRAVASGFTGLIGVEHEPETHDPSEECRVSLHRVRSWIA